jgi:glycosyltransferase involved in cell wall biosynthesis
VSQPGSEGVANYVSQVARAQAGRGDRVAVACPDDTPLAAATRGDGIETHRWTASRSPGPDLARELIALRAIIQRVRPDVVHLHSSKAGMVGRLAVRRRHPTVFQPHAWSFHATPGALSPLTVGWERLAGHWADVIVAVSDDELAIARRRRIRAASVELTIPNPVDTMAFCPTPAYRAEAIHVRRSLGLEDEPLVVCVGRLCRQKGQDRLLQIWPSVIARVPTAQLLLVGDGPYRADLEATDHSQVHFLGTRADVAAILRAAQIVALPSRWEGMSLALLEAMATGRPVVATAVPGSRETIGRGAGAVVDQNQDVQLAREIVARLENPALARREGATGRRLVARRNRLLNTIDALDGAYERAEAAHGVVQRHRPPRAVDERVVAAHG